LSVSAVPYPVMTGLTIMKSLTHISKCPSLNMSVVLVTCVIWIIGISDTPC